MRPELGFGGLRRRQSGRSAIAEPGAYRLLIYLTDAEHDQKHEPLVWSGLSGYRRGPSGLGRR
jgi:hypothetical protein